MNASLAYNQTMSNRSFDKKVYGELIKRYDKSITNAIKQGSFEVGILVPRCLFHFPPYDADVIAEKIQRHYKKRGFQLVEKDGVCDFSLSWYNEEESKEEKFSDDDEEEEEIVEEEAGEDEASTSSSSSDDNQIISVQTDLRNRLSNMTKHMGGSRF
jgi:hypothetical protein